MPIQSSAIPEIPLNHQGSGFSRKYEYKDFVENEKNIEDRLQTNFIYQK